MNNNWTIRSVDTETRLKLKILAVSRGIPIGILLKNLADEEMARDNSRLGIKIQRQIKKTVGRFLKNYADHS